MSSIVSMGPEKLYMDTMKHADIVGFARIIPSSPDEPYRQKLEIVDAVKGGRGIISMAPWRNDVAEFGGEVGYRFSETNKSPFLVALTLSDKGYYVQECVQLQADELEKRGLLRLRERGIKPLSRSR
ncbi:hypothetical protein [Sphingomonas endolithica]|uniref:hypothetical protein n=1 Tax=Sphingomonas endolithica TaxID=2972485 RepID=UPI0021AEB344|nr:hypothetical protein [Sphingomonas sp. ZFBP2030]